MRPRTNTHVPSVRAIAALVFSLSACGSDDSTDVMDNEASDASSTSDAGSEQEPLPDGSTPSADASQDALDGGESDATTDASTEGDASSATGDGAVGADDDYAAVLKDKIESCGFLPDAAPVQVAGIASPSALCDVLCFANASCEQLEAPYCGASVDPLFEACRDACTFSCADGSGGALPTQCDGEVDCLDGSDELGCDGYYFTCDNGEQINITLLCDGTRNCADYSDEDFCETPFTCGALLLPQSAVCNLVVECNDGSDEADCPLTCDR